MFDLSVRQVERRLRRHWDELAAAKRQELRRRQLIQRAHDRTALAAAISDAGFGHAVATVAGAVAVEVCGPWPEDRPNSERQDAHDRRLTAAANDLAIVVLEAAAHYARTHGWRRLALVEGPSPGASRLRGS